MSRVFPLVGMFQYLLFISILHDIAVSPPFVLTVVSPKLTQLFVLRV